jgi:hypothetical protein
MPLLKFSEQLPKCKNELIHREERRSLHNILPYTIQVIMLMAIPSGASLSKSGRSE